jgi:hypothetical protein
MSRYVDPFGKELAPFAMPEELLGVGDCGWPIKTYSDSLSDQCPRGGVVATGPRVYVI